jgi:hypothetical protein
MVGQNGMTRQPDNDPKRESCSKCGRFGCIVLNDLFLTANLVNHAAVVQVHANIQVNWTQLACSSLSSRSFRHQVRFVKRECTMTDPPQRRLK